LPDSASGGKNFRLSTSAMVIIVYSCRSASLTESDFDTLEFLKICKRHFSFVIF
jgi:maleate cis-trans isomerase